MTGQDYSKILANLQLEKAFEAYEVGTLALENGKLISAVNRLYYAVFYGVAALLQMRGQSFAKHTAVRAALHRDLVRPGIVPVEFGEMFDQLFKDRQDGDYRPETKFDSKEIAAVASQTGRFLEFIKNLLAKGV